VVTLDWRGLVLVCHHLDAVVVSLVRLSDQLIVSTQLDLLLRPMVVVVVVAVVLGLEVGDVGAVGEGRRRGLGSACASYKWTIVLIMYG
jgi:hypothetical protein